MAEESHPPSKNDSPESSFHHLQHRLHYNNDNPPQNHHHSNSHLHNNHHPLQQPQTQMGKILVRGFSTSSFSSLKRHRKASEVSETTNLISTHEGNTMNDTFSWSNASDFRIDPYQVVEEPDTVLPKEILPRIEAFDADRIWYLNYVEGAIFLEV